MKSSEFIELEDDDLDESPLKVGNTPMDKNKVRDQKDVPGGNGADEKVFVTANDIGQSAPKGAHPDRQGVTVMSEIVRKMDTVSKSEKRKTIPEPAEPVEPLTPDTAILRLSSHSIVKKRMASTQSKSKQQEMEIAKWKEYQKQLQYSDDTLCQLKSVRDVLKRRV